MALHSLTANSCKSVTQRDRLRGRMAFLRDYNSGWSTYKQMITTNRDSDDDDRTAIVLASISVMLVVPEGVNGTAPERYSCGRIMS